MTRPDVKQKYLGEFLDWSLTTLAQTSDKSITDIMVLDGVLQSLVNNIKNIIHLNSPAIFVCSHTSVYVAIICVLLLLCYNMHKNVLHLKLCLSNVQYHLKTNSCLLR